MQGAGQRMENGQLLPGSAPAVPPAPAPAKEEASR
jgi:hypothetical protein